MKAVPYPYAGDFSQPIAVRRHDELGDLAGQISIMGQDIHQMLEAKRDLLLAISHELRSPLTRARLNTELLPDTPDSKAPRDALLRDLAEMGRLIADLLESERLSGNHAPLNLELTDLGQVVRDRVADAVANATAKVEASMDAPFAPPPTGFEVTVAEGLPLVQVDAVRIRLLLRNLLDNALRHSLRGTPDSGISVGLHSRPNSGLNSGLNSGPNSGQPECATLEVDLRRHTDAVSGCEALHLRVRDHGAGVAEAQLPHLAEPFFRADAGRQRSTGGGGWGWGFTCAAWWRRRTVAVCDCATRSRGWK